MFYLFVLFMLICAYNARRKPSLYNRAMAYMDQQAADAPKGRRSSKKQNAGYPRKKPSVQREIIVDSQPPSYGDDDGYFASCSEEYQGMGMGDEPPPYDPASYGFEDEPAPVVSPQPDRPLTLKVNGDLRHVEPRVQPAKATHHNVAPGSDSDDEFFPIWEMEDFFPLH